MSRALAAALAALTLSATQTLAQEEPKLAEERIVLRTDLGDIVLALYPEVAPRHSARILELASAGVYDGVHFYRVHPGFVAQLSSAEDRPIRLRPEQAALIQPLPLETSALEHRAGVLSMARRNGEPDSAETSFSILLGEAPHLDGQYTIFGRVEHGMEVLAAIAAVPKDESYRPAERVNVQKALVLDSAAQLDGFALNPAQWRSPRQPPPAAGQPEPGDLPLIALMAIAGSMLCGLATFWGAARLSPRNIGALGSLVVLFGFVALFLTLAPRTHGSGLLATLVLFGSFALFRLMSYFESPRA